ncbi:hypothetical protein O9Z70_00510 [Devosia sp. YIM 151766]|uniref:hypothetical protein n=1 Tax=Devosia sp. YIM 151766 TaxID=3017325 RepID=UPI00255CB482|nr:hypothetical protein [Devosia sp. YIM 151766]WIY53063.1 hypothetical protein O9Z70_00510 [Devosia sp. YIM 151766]
MRTFAALSTALLLLATPVFAQDEGLSPEGTWIDAEGTSFTFSLCGDGTALCGVLNDIQGASRTEENMAFVNTEVVQAEQTAPNLWEGTINYGGRQAAAKVALVAEDAIEITGCQLLILCETITFYKAS